MKCLILPIAYDIYLSVERKKMTKMTILADIGSTRHMANADATILEWKSEPNQKQPAPVKSWVAGQTFLARAQTHTHIQIKAFSLPWKKKVSGCIPAAPSFSATVCPWRKEMQKEELTFCGKVKNHYAYIPAHKNSLEMILFPLSLLSLSRPVSPNPSVCWDAKDWTHSQGVHREKDFYSFFLWKVGKNWRDFKQASKETKKLRGFASFFW